MATIKPSYATPVAIACTVANLADGGYRESDYVDNSTNLYMDAHVGGKIQVGTVTTDGQIEIWAYGSWDGVDYSGGLAGVNETVTWSATPTPASASAEGYNQLKLLGVVSVDTTDDDNDIEFGPFTVAPAFGGIMPEKWGIVVKNSTGVALHATGTNNSIKYRGISYTAA